MKSKKFGRLERVTLRDYWEREDLDFTPWLAEEQNIALLGEALDLELETQGTEKQVGPFRADILCRNTADNSLVLIENQLERTDHTHLGQIFTYAAGLNAVTVVWIAKKFTEEHRAAVDWLNRITREEFNFFGLEVELWRIGDSAPAPKFNLVAKPNDWAKVVAEATANPGSLTNSQEKQVQFWKDFGQVIEEQQRDWKVPKPSSSSWVGYGIGRRGFAFNPTISLQSGSVGVRVYMHDADAKAHFYLLAQQRAEIERELGFPLVWHEKPGQKQSYIECREEGDLNNPTERKRLITWILDRMDLMDRVLRPRIKVLDASEWVDAED